MVYQIIIHYTNADFKKQYFQSFIFLRCTYITTKYAFISQNFKQKHFNIDILCRNTNATFSIKLALN